MATTTTRAPVEDETDLFAGICLLGLELIKDTIARDLREKDKVVAAAEPHTEAGRAVIEKGGDYKPLQPGESLWDGGISRRRRDNIIGGWA